MSQLAELRRKRQGQLPLAQPTAEAAAGTLRAGALGQGDEWGQCMRQLETMTKQAIDYSELGTMLLVRLDGISERASRAQEQEPMLQDAVDAEDAAAVLQRRRSVVRKVQALVQLTDTNREQLLTRLEKLRPPVAVPAKMAGGVGNAWRKLVDSGMIKGVVIAGVALGGWQAAASAGGMEMLALLSVHSALNALDLAGEEARRYQRAWFPSLEQHRASRSVGVQAWEAEEASFTSAVVRWKRDSRRYERDVCVRESENARDSARACVRASARANLYSCMHTCIHVYTHTCMHTHTCRYAFVHTRTYSVIHVRVHSHEHIHAHICLIYIAYMYTCISVCVNIHSV